MEAAATSASDSIPGGIGYRQVGADLKSRDWETEYEK